MSSAFDTSLSGMLATQSLLDVTANNLANAETVGFKSSRVQFSDQLYRTVAAAQAPVSPSGGINPSQVGQGVLVNAIDVQMTQGSVTPTGRDLDVAITGSGFFRLQQPDGTEVYTRLGDFGFDAGGANQAPRLVELGTGYPVLNTLGATISPVNTIPASATTELELSGNLPPKADQPLHGTALGGLFRITSSVDGTAANTSTALSTTNLGTGSSAATALNVFGTQPDGTSYSATVALSAGATAGDLVTALNQAFTLPGGRFATASLENGQVKVESGPGGTALSVFLGESPLPALPATNAAANTWQHGAGGTYRWNLTRLVPSGSSVTSTFTSYTADGTQHSLDVRLFNSGIDATGGRVWDLVAGTPLAANGAITGTGVVQGYTFDQQGTLTTDPGGTLGVNWTVGGASSVALTATSLTGYQGDGYADVADFTGYAAGRLVSTSIDSLGFVVGAYSNGKSQPMSTTGHQLGMAIFANPGGLDALGGSMWAASANSGTATNVAPGANGDNSITGGALEGANVDVAVEFTRLILAQRTFQSNTRTFSVADQMMQDANALVR